MTVLDKSKKELIEELEALRKSEERLRLAMSVASDGLWDWNLETGEMFFGPRWLETLGYREGELEPHVDSWKQIVHPDDMPQVMKALEAHFEGKTPIYECENRLRTKSGEYRWNLDRGRVVRRDADGRPLRMVGIDADITRRKQAEQRFSNLVEMMPEAVVIVNGRDRMVFVNRQTEKLFGYHRDELVGESLEILIPERFRSEHRRHREGYVTKPISRNMGTGRDLSCLRKDGTEFPAEIYLNPIPEDDELLVVSTIRDITERRQAVEALEESEEKYRMLFTQMLDGFALHEIVYDEAGRPTDSRFLEVNPSFERLTGLRGRDVIGKTVRQVIPAIEPNWIDAYREVALFGKPARFERFTPGLNKHFQIAAFRPCEGRLVIIFTDITERKQQERALRTLKDELEENVIKRTAELDRANKELEAFSYSVSHDLRAPLRHMMGFVSLLEQHAGSAMDEKVRRYARIIADSAKKMGQLIDDLLEFSRTSRAQLKRRPINVTTLVKEVQRQCVREADARPIVWKIHSLPDVKADRSLLRLVLVNLLSNAVKFTRGRQEPTIEIGTIPADDGAVVVFVRDNGAGFDDKYAGKLFGVFQRLHSSEDYEGTGIGLANVKRIMQRHGGDVWAEGRVDRGATFYFSLPTAGGTQRKKPAPNLLEKETTLRQREKTTK